MGAKQKAYTRIQEAGSVNYAGKAFWLLRNSRRVRSSPQSRPGLETILTVRRTGWLCDKNSRALVRNFYAEKPNQAWFNDVAKFSLGSLHKSDALFTSTLRRCANDELQCAEARRAAQGGGREVWDGQARIYALPVPSWLLAGSTGLAIFCVFPKIVF